uniref:Uncharacterized protein n=1 Tax=viral metagenome TaxID=1070528 RepID=A0A6C0JTX8_9ZZZZ
MSVTIIVIDKNGIMKSQNVKHLTPDTIYKKCGLRNSNGFHRRHVWYIHTMDVDTIELWSCDTVKSGLDNKYELPPPLETKVYYGSMVLISVQSDGTYVNLSLNTWTQIYENLLEDGSNHEDSQDNTSVTFPDTHLSTNYDSIHYEEDNEESEENESTQEENTTIYEDVFNDEEYPEFIEALHGDGSELQEEEYN